MKKNLLCLITGIITFSAQAQVDVAATSGTATATYTTLKGAFDAINTGTHQGTINISITGNTTETATAVLNVSGGTSSYTSIFIKPAPTTTPTISGSLASAPVIKILGSNVTIDGTNATGTSRDLTITNTSTTGPQVIAAASASSTAPITNLVIKNSNIINGINSSSALVMTDGNTTAAGGFFNNVTIQNNSIQKAYVGIYLWAAIAAGNGVGTLVKDNDLSSSGANAIRLAGIYYQGLDGGTINNNTIGNFDTTNAEIRRGIWLATGTVNSTITSNTINNLSYTGTSSGGAVGISVTSGNTGAVAVSNNLINKNVISNLNSSGTNTTTAGLLMGILVSGLTNGVTISQNNIYKVRNTNTGGYGAEGIALLSTATTNAANVVNNFISDISGYGYNLGTGVADNGYGIFIAGGSGYNIYYNTVNLTVNQTLATSKGSAINITSAVTAAGAIDLRNNIFVSNQTVPGYAIYSTAANTVFSNINYNDYYSAAGSLGYIGSERANLAAIQAGFGGNANSLNVLPIFTSANDLHLVTTANTNIGLDDKGTPIAGVTIDYDDSTRSTTIPDLGASEFTTAVLAVQDISKSKISYYPNPVVDELHLNSEGKITNVEIYNASGQSLRNIEINSEKGSIDMKQLPAGVYMLKVNPGKESQSIKIIKNN